MSAQKFLPVGIMAVMLFGCSQQESATKAAAPAASPEHFAAGVSQKISRAMEVKGGMCPIDSINKQPLQGVLAAQKSQPFGIEGWAVTETSDRPVPPLVFVRLDSGAGAFYLEGKRKKRPDIAKGNQLLEDAGYEAAGYLSNVPAGQYDIKILTGDEGTIFICSTGKSLTVQ